MFFGTQSKDKSLSLCIVSYVPSKIFMIVCVCAHLASIFGVNVMSSAVHLCVSDTCLKDLSNRGDLCY